MNKIFNYLLLITICFPFIPQLIPESDNQPTFSVILLIYFFLIAISSNTKFKISYKLILISLIFLFILLISAGLVIEDQLYYTRIFSFIQFLLAIIFSISSYFKFNVSWFKSIFGIYFLFTIIFFISNGLVEDFLISSRLESSSNLLLSGRGARTLSPEPAIFAKHLLNLIVLYFLITKKEIITGKQFLIISIMLISSLSGYGFMIFLVLFFLFFRRLFYLSGFLFFIIIGFLDFTNFLNFRFVQLINGILNEGLTFLYLDSSFVTRLNSFFIHFESLMNNLLVGDSFSIYGGGGFISIISAFGLFAVFFFLLIIIKIVLKKSTMKLKFLLLFWFSINFLSGSFSNAIIGIIIGLILKPNIFKLNEKNINSTSSL